MKKSNGVAGIFVGVLKVGLVFGVILLVIGLIYRLCGGKSRQERFKERRKKYEAENYPPEPWLWRDWMLQETPASPHLKLPACWNGMPLDVRRAIIKGMKEKP